MQDATALHFLQSHPRENACKLPTGRAKWGFWLPGVQILTLDWRALLPVMSRAAYSFFMALSLTNLVLGSLQLIKQRGHWVVCNS